MLPRGPDAVQNSTDVRGTAVYSPSHTTRPPAATSVCHTWITADLHAATGLFCCGATAVTLRYIFTVGYIYVAATTADHPCATYHDCRCNHSLLTVPALFCSALHTVSAFVCGGASSATFTWVLAVRALPPPHRPANAAYIIFLLTGLHTTVNDIASGSFPDMRGNCLTHSAPVHGPTAVIDAGSLLRARQCYPLLRCNGLLPYLRSDTSCRL